MQHCGKSRSMDFRLWPIKGTTEQDRSDSALIVWKPLTVHFTVTPQHVISHRGSYSSGRRAGYRSNEGLVVRSLAAPVCIPMYSSSYAMTCFGQLVLLCGDMTLESFTVFFTENFPR